MGRGQIHQGRRARYGGISTLVRGDGQLYGKLEVLELSESVLLGGLAGWMDSLLDYMHDNLTYTVLSRTVFGCLQISSRSGQHELFALSLI